MPEKTYTADEMSSGRSIRAPVPPSLFAIPRYLAPARIQRSKFPATSVFWASVRPDSKMSDWKSSREVARSFLVWKADFSL